MFEVSKEYRKKLDEMFAEQDKNLSLAARALKIMAHPARLKILCILRDGEQTVQNIEYYTDLSQSNLSQHLSLLRDRKIVNVRRDGGYSIYFIDNPHIVELFELITKIYC